ncbi:MAG: transglycosylase SLT domain-containing protein [bacterium]
MPTLRDMKLSKKSLCFFILFFLSTMSLYASYNYHASSFIPDPEQESKTSLTALAKQDGATGDYFKLRLAEQMLKESKTTGAFKWANKVQGPLFSFWKTVVLSEAYINLDKPHQVLALLKVLPKEPEHEKSFGEGLYGNVYKRALICRYLAQKQLNKNPTKDIATLLSLFPEDSNVSELFTQEERATTLTSKQKVTQLHNRYINRAYKNIPQAITAKEIKSAPVKKEEKCRALFELGSAMQLNKKYYDVSIGVFWEVVNMGCKGDFRPRALYRMATISPSKTSGLPDVRKKMLTRLTKEYPQHYLADDAYYKLYRIAKVEKDTKNANKYYSELMGLKTGDMKSELAFSLAYPYYKKKKYKTAIKYLSKAVDTIATPDESHTKVLYWYARSLEKTNISKDKKKASALYTTLITDYPFSFYALLAAKHLNKKINIPLIPQLAATQPQEQVEFFDTLDTFNAKGFHEAAVTLLDFFLHEHPDWEKNHTEFLVQKLLESHSYRKALDLAVTSLDTRMYGLPQGLDSPLFAAFYPLAYSQNIEAVYKSTPLPKGTIEGIVREESLFQRSAVSHAGALGLMQLMPPTAAFVRKSLQSSDKKTPSITNNVKDPLTNILLGSTYLDQMKKKFNDELPLAIMAYNAGPGNVRKWLKSSGGKEMAVFIEDIPFTETKGYVKRVLRTMHVYGTLYKNPYFTKVLSIDPLKIYGTSKKKKK